LVTACVRTNLLKHVIEGKIKERIEVTGRQGRRSKHLQDDLKERRGYIKLIALCGELALEEPMDHSPPSSAEVKNEWSYTSTTHMPS
jgi:hypothetical protein